MEFAMITDTKMISPPLSHLISGLEFIFNHFLYLKNLIYMMRRLLLPNSNESSHLIRMFRLRMSSFAVINDAHR
jgi:hypothetical protein